MLQGFAIIYRPPKWNCVEMIPLLQREDCPAPPATKLDDGIFTSSEEGLPTAPSDNNDSSSNIAKALEKLESIRNDNEE